MFDDILAGVQSVAEAFMLTDVTIQHRIDGSEDTDDENPFGDDTVEMETSTTTVKGWIVDPATRSLEMTGGMSVVVSELTVRLPTGTVTGRGDILTVNGKEFRVVGDLSEDDTWPAMVKVHVSRIE
jgi:hypothetical protein